MSELRQNFEKSFPIPAHWIEWSESKNRYDCHVGLADSKCAEYNKMFNVWCVQQAKVDEIEHQKSLQELAINQISQANQEWQRINAELQKQIDELQKRIDEANQELEGVIRFTQEDVEPNFEYMKLTALNSFARLQESLRGEHE